MDQNTHTHDSNKHFPQLSKSDKKKIKKNVLEFVAEK